MDKMNLLFFYPGNDRALTPLPAAEFISTMAGLLSLMTPISVHPASKDGIKRGIGPSERAMVALDHINNTIRQSGEDGPAMLIQLSALLTWNATKVLYSALGKETAIRFSSLCSSGVEGVYGLLIPTIWHCNTMDLIGYTIDAEWNALSQKEQARIRVPDIAFASMKKDAEKYLAGMAMPLSNEDCRDGTEA